MGSRHRLRPASTRATLAVLRGPRQHGASHAVYDDHRPDDEQEDWQRPPEPRRGCNPTQRSPSRPQSSETAPSARFCVTSFPT